MSGVQLEEGISHCVADLIEENLASRRLSCFNRAFSSPKVNSGDDPKLETSPLFKIMATISPDTRRHCKDLAPLTKENTCL